MMEIVSLTTDKYQEWNSFCLKSSDGWFWHSTEWLNYTLAYIPNSTSLSFLVTENEEILAICPLILKENEFDLFWSPAFANLPEKRKERVITFTFDYIDKLALENKVKRSSFMIYPISFPRYNYLMKQGYIDISLNTQVIDLTQDLENLHSSLRKGHDYDIDRGLRLFGITIWDKSNITREIFDAYCNLHHKDAGRITRPQSTFNMQFDWILKNNAVLLGAVAPMDATSPVMPKSRIDIIGFSYIFTYKNSAYYGSACSDPNYSNFSLPIGHILTWKAIEWLKEHKFEYYEIGWQQYGNLPYDIPSKKEIEISFFKRGFGGFTIPLYRGEKYYDKDYYLKVNLERTNRYALELETRT